MRPKSIAEEKFRYQLTEDEWLLKKVEEFEDFVKECKKKLEIEKYNIQINYVLLLNVFVRIDERKDYFMYFHSEDDSMHMSLGKEIALEAYWISKYKPLRITAKKISTLVYDIFNRDISKEAMIMYVESFLK